MKNLVLYGLGGLGAVVLFAAVTKRRPKRLIGPAKLYVVAPGDKTEAVAARFGISTQAFLKANVNNKAQKRTLLLPGTVKMLPAGSRDFGPVSGARGVAK